MKIKQFNTIKFKVGLVVALSFVLVVGLFVSYISLTVNRRSKQNAREKTLALAHDYAAQIAADMAKPREVAVTLSQVFVAAKSSEQNSLTRTQALAMLYKVLENKPDFFAIGTAWESNAFDGRDSLFRNQSFHDITGRFVPYLYRNTLGDIELEPLANYDNKFADWYKQTREARHDIITPPYERPVGGRNIQMISLSSPIMQGDDFLGVVTVDMPLQDFQNNILKEKFGKTPEQIKIIAHNGAIVAISDSTELIGTNIKDHYTDHQKRLKQIHQAQDYSFINKQTAEARVPLLLSHQDQAWQLCVSMSPAALKAGNAAIYRQLLWTIIAGILIIGLIMILIIWLTRRFLAPLDQIAHTANRVSQGMLEYTNIQTSAAEVKQIDQSFKQIVEMLKSKSRVVEAIAKDDLEHYVDISSEHDILGQSINKTIDSLRQARQEHQQREKQDHQQAWVSQGLAEFADLLRQNNDNLQKLSKNIIRHLVKYLDANQGGLFLIDDNNPNDVHIELMAAFAYDRFRKMKKRLELEEGLIGRCIDEQASIYMTEIPQGYISITSGLGGQSPTALLIVPLKLNEKIFGAIELASFKQIKSYQIDFVEKLSDSITSTIASVKINIHTAKLLKESQEQSEKLSQQEEELRQNLEELQATQEEAARRETEIIGQIEAINQTNALVEFDLEGSVEKANQIFCKLTGYDQAELEALHHRNLLCTEETQQSDYQLFWQKLRAGEVISGEFRLQRKDQETIYVKAAYTPVFDTQDRPYKVLLLAFDTTEMHLSRENLQEQTERLVAQEEELRQNLEELQATQEESAKREAEMLSILNGLNTAAYTAELNTDGKILNINDAFAALNGQIPKRMIGSWHREYTRPNDPEEYPDGYQAFWNKLRQGETQRKISLLKPKDNTSTCWVAETYTPIYDDKGAISKILNIAFDITESKKQQQKLENQAEEMKAQEDMMRQSMAAIQTAQAEAAKHQAETEGILNALNKNSLVAEFNPQGEIIYINHLFAELIGEEPESLLLRHHREFHSLAKDQEAYTEFWDKLTQGQAQQIVSKIAINNKMVWLQETYSPIYDKNGLLIKILDIATDITTTKQQQEALIEQQEEMMAQEEMMRHTLKEYERLKEELKKKNDE